MLLPPGPSSSPLRQAVEFGRDPYGYLARSAAEHGPVFTLRLPGDPPRVVVCEPAEIRRIFALRSEDILACPDGVPVNLGKHTLLLSTHILQEVEAMADRVLFINRGRIVFDGEPAAMRERWESLDAAFHALTEER